MKKYIIAFCLLIAPFVSEQYVSSFSGSEIDQAIDKIINPSYKVYAAWLVANNSFSGNAPEAIVLENTLGADIVWTRYSAGVYNGTPTINVFQQGKVVVLFNDNAGAASVSRIDVYLLPYVAPEYIQLRNRDAMEFEDWHGKTQMQIAGTAFNCFHFIEIRVYN